METLILYGSIAGALTAIIVLFTRLMGAINALKDVIHDWKEDQDFANYTRMCSLRMFIMDERFPLNERIEAGEKYIAHGWNGSTKAWVETMKEFRDEDIEKKVRGTL